MGRQQRLLLDAEANVDCRRQPGLRSRLQRVHAGRVSELVAVAKNRREKAPNAEAELPQPGAGVFRS